MKKAIFLFISSWIFGLDYYIPPEILNDTFYEKIIDLSSRPTVKNILEIGSSCGEGSTSAFLRGISKNQSKPRLYCVEVSKTRFEILQSSYQNHPQISVYNVSSVPLRDFPKKKDVVNFYKKYDSRLRNYALHEVLQWLEQDIRYLTTSGVNQNGIETIKKENGISCFDIVLIDGSEFTGEAELKYVYGAKYILLDDILAFKNYFNYKKLLQDCNYKLIAEDLNLRNGWAAFEKND